LRLTRAGFGPMRETAVEAHLRRRAIAEGALVRKMIWPGHRGAPDRLVIWPGPLLRAVSVEPKPTGGYRREVDVAFAAQNAGLVDFVELKRPGGKPDPHQEREHEKLRDHGCTVFVLDSIEAVEAYINERKR